MDGIFNPHQNRYPPLLLAPLPQQTLPLVDMGRRRILRRMLHCRLCWVCPTVLPRRGLLDAHRDEPLYKQKPVISWNCDIGSYRRRHSSHPADPYRVEIEGRQKS